MSEISPSGDGISLGEGLLEIASHALPKFLPNGWQVAEQYPSEFSEKDIEEYEDSGREVDQKFILEITKLCKDDPNNLLRLFILMSGFSTGENDKKFYDTLRDKTELLLDDDPYLPGCSPYRQDGDDLPRRGLLLELHGQPRSIMQLLSMYIREINSNELIENFFKKLKH